MLEITLTCPMCGTQNHVPVAEEVAEFTCVSCNESSPITETLGAWGGPPKDRNIGKHISECEIVEKVGEGGFGSVYKAIDSTLQRPVALKLLLRELTSKPEFVTKFYREAVTAAKLNHPHIVAIHKFGQEYLDGEEVHYLIMEFLEGKTLADVIEEKGELPVDEAIAVVLQAADALASAHEKSVIHRDIKPENLMVDSRGNVKITDFGLAKVVSTTMQTTKVVGTPHYMSPEQFEGKAVDGRTDIYSLGVTFYYILTRAKPYKGDNTVQIIYAILTNEPRPPMEINPGVSDELWSIIRKMIAKDPENRYQSFRDVQKDLEAFRDRSLRATVACPECEAENPIGRRFCRECGSPLATECPGCGAAEPAGTKHCGQCGTNIPLARSVKDTAGKASQARSRGELHAALRLYEEILEIQPDNEEADKATRELRAEVGRLDGIREQAHDLVSRGDLEEALSRVDEAIKSTPSPALESLRTEIETQVTGKAVDAHRMVAEEALAAYDHTAAVAALKKARDLDPDDPDIELELRRAEKNEADLATSLEQARVHFDAQRFDLAYAEAKKALVLAPESDVARDISERAKGFLESVDSFLDQARERLSEGRYEEARTAAESALEIDVTSVDAEELAREVEERLTTFKGRMEEVQTFVDAGQHESARAMLEELQGERPFDERLQGLRATCEELAAHEERTRRVEGLVASGRAAEKEGHLEDALASYEEALGLDAESERARNLLDKVSRKLEDATGLEILAREHETEGNLARAMDALERLLVLRGNAPEVQDRLRAIRERKDELDRTVDEAEAALEDRRLDDAERLAADALAISPGHRRAEKVRTDTERQRSTAAKLLTEARNRISGELFDEALTSLQKAEDAGCRADEIEELRAQAERGRVEVLKSNATRSFRFEDFDAAIRAFDEVLDVDPGDPEAIAGRRAARRRLRAQRRESPLVKLSAAVVLLLGLGGVQLLAVSRPLEAAEGEGAESAAIRPPVRDVVDVVRTETEPWKTTSLTDADYHQLVRSSDWEELDRLVRKEEERFRDHAAVARTRDWVEGMREMGNVQAVLDDGGRDREVVIGMIEKLKALSAPKVGPLREIAPTVQAGWLRKLQVTLHDRTTWLGLAQDTSNPGQLVVLRESLALAQAHGTAADAQGLTDTVEFVDALIAAMGQGDEKDPVQAIRDVYGVTVPASGPLRSAAEDIRASWTTRMIERGLVRAGKAEGSDRGQALQLYTQIADALGDLGAKQSLGARAVSGRKYVSAMDRGDDSLNQAQASLAAASGVSWAESAVRAFERADESFHKAVELSTATPDEDLRAARTTAAERKASEDLRAARTTAAERKASEVKASLEEGLVELWPRSEADWRDEEKLKPAWRLFALYARIMKRNHDLTLEGVHNHLDGLVKGR